MIGRITQAIASGEVVDWDSVNRSQDSARNGEQIRNLHRIDRLWRPTAAAPATESTRSDSPSLDGWTFASRVVVALAVFHVVLGVAGFLLAPVGALLPSITAQMFAVPVFAATAAWLLLGGRRDGRAARLGATYLACAAAFAHGSAVWAWGQLPSPLGAWSLPRALLPDAFLGFWLWGFAARFPRVVRLSASDNWMVWGERAAGAVGVALFAVNFFAVSFPAATPSWASPLVRTPSSLYWLLSIGVSFPALALMILRTREAPKVERRRVALLSSAVVVGLGPMGVAVLAELISGSFRAFVSVPEHRAWEIAMLFGFALTTPLSTAACIKSQHVLPVRFVYHAAARYVLLPSSLTAALVAPLVWLGAFLYEGRRRPLEELVSTSQGRGLMAAAVVAILLLSQREAVYRWIRRLFLGQAHDWSGLLNSSGPLVRHARTPRELEDSLARHVKGHAHFGAMRLMLRSRDGRAFEPVGGGAPLAADSALAEVVFAGEAALATSVEGADDVAGLLPPADRSWLEASRIGLITPLLGQGGERIGLLAFGSTGEGLPYTRDEREFATMLAGLVALALERHLVAGQPGPDGSEEPALECEGCHRVAMPQNGHCECGGVLQEVPLPWVLAGRFKLEGRLGRGGMGVVYRAQDLRLRRDVALKTLPRVSGEAAERLSAEARSMAGFQHPNVAFLLDFQSWRGVPVLIVEYLPGGTLRDLLGRRWTWDETAELGLVVCDALAAMHKAGVTHRDIKPSNIGFARDGTAKVLDFGLARVVAQAEGEASPYRVVEASNGSMSYLGGTPLYMSPEAVRGGTPGQQFDLWSLGVVLYELATGQHPFRDRDRFVSALRHGRLPRVASPVGLRAEFPPLASEFLRDALNEDADRRPATAADFASALRSTLT